MYFIIEHLCKHFEQKEVLRDIDFAFQEGKIYGLLGRNGAGKTTLFNCLNRDIKADGGTFYLEEDGLRREVTAEDFGYRTSIFLERGWIVTEAEFLLPFDTDGQARVRYDEFSARRREKQPLSWPSAGSTFKRPEGYYAGALIEAAGLKGLTVGGAQVSELHAGFVINRGGATAGDILSLIALVQEKVFAQSGVRLEPEVRIVGED